MVERIRHRDGADSHHYDLKFTIVPIYSDNKHQVDHNILENRLKNHMKKTFILRDSDYPNYFQVNGNRRSDLFSPGFERSMSSFLNINPNSLMQSFLGLSPPQKQKNLKDGRLNKGEFYSTSKIQTSPKVHFPNINGHASHVVDHRVRFPDSREITTTINKPPMNLYRPKPEIYNKKNIIDFRGASDNVFVGSSDNRQTQSSFQQPPPQVYQQTSTHLQQLPANYHQFQENLQQPQQNFQQQPNIYQQQPNIYQQQQQQNSYQQSNYQQQQQNQPIPGPIFSIPVDMPIIQLAQSSYPFPFQLQLSTPTNQNQAQFPQTDVTTFRYQPQLIGLSNHPSTPLFNPYLPVSLLPSDKPKFKESERHTMNYYSPPDPVYHQQQQQSPSTTEAPIQPSTYSPRLNNYANIVRHQLERPVIGTASSIQVSRYDDNEFHPISPFYDARKFKNVSKASSTVKPDSINAQLVDTYDDDVNVTIPYVTLPPVDDTSEKVNEISYKVVLDRPKSSSVKPSEKPVLKWVPKKQRNKKVNDTSSTPSTLPQNPFRPTLLPDTTTQQSTKLTTHIFRGRNRFNKRNSSANAKTSTISPITTKIVRKKTTNIMAISSLSTPSPYLSTSSIFPTYITPQATDEPITSQSFSTSVSLEVNGERVFDATTTPGYELIPAGVESINTNSSNIKLFKASVVPEKFDDLTFSILNHAKVIEGGKKEK